MTGTAENDGRKLIPFRPLTYIQSSPSPPNALIRDGAILCAVFLTIAWYLLRLRFLRKKFDFQFQQRITEHDRNANELHEALLQSLHGLILQFHTATKLVPVSEPGRSLLEQALTEAEGVAKQLSGQINALYQHTDVSGDLPYLVKEDGRTITAKANTTFSLIVQGKPEGLFPFVKGQVRQIVREALTNACQHSNAGDVTVTITYNRFSLRVAVHDNGRGIAQAILDTGSKPGHWGFIGMREKTEQIGGELSVQTGPDNGTTVTLEIPAGRAFLPSRVQRFFNRENGRPN